jgi:hypothetical protein
MLKLVGGVRWKAPQHDVVFETELQDFEGFMCREAITYQCTRYRLGSFFGLWLKHKFEPLQVEIGISISTVEVCVMPTGSWKGDPIRSVSRCRPDDHQH